MALIEASPTTREAVRGPQNPNTITQTLAGPFSDWHWIEQSLFLAEVSRLAYFPSEVVTPIVAQAGLATATLIDRDGAQAYLLYNDNDLMVICRGTEPHDWNDLRADAKAWTVVAEVGRLHIGFKSEVDHLWPMIEEAIRDNHRTAWFAGHSLGGAMATVCAGRCKLSSIPSNPRALFTFGSPRVGNRAYTHAMKLAHYRWVNNNDIVTRIPPRWMGYRHSGFELYLNSNGALKRLFSWRRSRDRFRGLWSSMFKGRVDYLSDHSMIEYIRNIKGCWTDYRNGKPLLKPKVIIDGLDI